MIKYNQQIIELIRSEVEYLLVYHKELIDVGQFKLKDCSTEKISFQSNFMEISFHFSFDRFSKETSMNFDYLEIEMDGNKFKLGELLQRKNMAINLKEEVSKNLNNFISKNDTYQQLITKYLLDFFKTGEL